MSEVKECNLTKQGYPQGSCLTEAEDKSMPACKATLRKNEEGLSRLITSCHLSRPENYLSLYQSGCNFSCRKCHSWYFSKVADGEWYSPEDILEKCKAYERKVTLRERRKNATSWHAHTSCRCCGSCVVDSRRSDFCPGILNPEDIVLSPQGLGPARNIVAFTGGDITCQPDFYAACTRLIKEETNLWVLIETNGYGLIPSHLDLLKDSGVDAFWLDIKAYDPGVHKWLTGCNNDWILQLPDQMVKRGFVLEVLSLYIPQLVETSQLLEIAKILSEVDEYIPFTILAFFPEFRMKDSRSPKLFEMIDAYLTVNSAGLRNVRLGNTGIFAKSEEDHRILQETLGPDVY
jgi:pyruvate-formate lyase-activating enzyme